ncbi:thioesterase family protein [Hahella sp. SMD15-11]|uniref:Thioesterase family protein n=1 Tax=Thermohahella caldifontis TaxID=3142973 RepID=A0AB39UZB9_9GAMM
MLNDLSLLDAIEIPVRWGDMDAYGHVNNTVYFRYFEEARVRWLERNGFRVDGKDQGPILLQTSCTFLRPVHYPETLWVTTWCKEIGRTSFVTGHEVRSHNGETLYSEGFCKLVWLDHARHRSIPLPDTLLALLEKSLHARQAKGPGGR